MRSSGDTRGAAVTRSSALMMPPAAKISAARVSGRPPVSSHPTPCAATGVERSMAKAHLDSRQTGMLYLRTPYMVTGIGSAERGSTTVAVDNSGTHKQQNLGKRELGWGSCFLPPPLARHRSKHGLQLNMNCDVHITLY